MKLENMLLQQTYQMRPSKQKQSNSTPNLPHPNLLNSNQETLLRHREEIEETLNELHRLQSEIYQLNIPENPHSSSPVKKEIKQLSYLYENMSKPKQRNNLGVLSTDIEIALRVINHDWDPETKLKPEISEEGPVVQGNRIELMTKTKQFPPANKTTSNIKSLLRSTQKQVPVPPAHYQIPKQVLQQKFEQITKSPLSLSFISKNDKSQCISTAELYEFVNFTECEDFDPVEAAYRMFLNSDGEFDMSIYNQFNELLGLPRIKNVNTFIAAIDESNKPQQPGLETPPNEKQKNYGMRFSTNVSGKVTLEQFRKVLNLQL